MRALNRTRRERGSVLVITLLAVGMIAGAYLYVGVLGSRAAEITEARTAADAAAMAAATVKARVMNYEAFIVLADTVLLPLGQVTQNISAAQAAYYKGACEPAFNSTWFEDRAKCEAYRAQIARTAGLRPAVDRQVTAWLDGLEAMAEALDSVGPAWAEAEAVRAGLGVEDPEEALRLPRDTVAASFPLPGGRCGRLGIDMVSNGEKVRGRSACKDLVREGLERRYLTERPPRFADFNYLGDLSIGRLLSQGASCDKANQVPRLAPDWGRYRFSRGMTLDRGPSDRFHRSRLESLRRTQPEPALGTGWLLGMGCAEHYEQDHIGEESLWHMDWRARLVPCEYEREDSARQVLACGDDSLPAVRDIQEQFRRQHGLGIARHWRW